MPGRWWRFQCKWLIAISEKLTTFIFHILSSAKPIHGFFRFNYQWQLPTKKILIEYELLFPGYCGEAWTNNAKRLAT